MKAKVVIKIHEPKPVFLYSVILASFFKVRNVILKPGFNVKHTLRLGSKYRANAIIYVNLDVGILRNETAVKYHSNIFH